MRPRGYDTATKEMIQPKARKAINDAIKGKRWPLLLTGSVGTGKTCAAAVVYGEYARNALPMWHRADDLLLSISLGRQNGVQVEQWDQYREVKRVVIPFAQFVARAANASCVVLDDLGTRAPTESMYAALFDLLEWRRQKPLLITSNKTLPELASMYDDRIASRLAGGTVIVMSGKDQRARGVIQKVG